MYFMLNQKGLLCPCLQMTIRSLLWFSKPFSCSLEHYEPQSAEFSKMQSLTVKFLYRH